MERKPIPVWKKKINRLTLAEFMFACFVIDVIWYAVRGVHRLATVLVEKHKKKREEKVESDSRKDTE